MPVSVEDDVRNFYDVYGEPLEAVRGKMAKKTHAAKESKNNLRRPNLVQVAGQKSVKGAYVMFLLHLWPSGSNAVSQNNKIIVGRFGKAVLKLRNGRIGKNKYLAMKKGYHDIVPFNKTFNVTREERIQMESGVTHWPKEIHRVAKIRRVPTISCMKYLQVLDQKGMYPKM